MDIVNIFSFMAIALLLVLSPGPNGVLIAKTVPASGKSAGFANIAGFVAAFYLHGSLSILGISILLVQSSQIFLIFKLVGAIYLCYVGVKALLAAFKKKNTELQLQSKRKVSLSKAFWEGFLTNGLNPKVSMFYLAAFPQFISADANIASAYLLVFSHCVLNTIWFSLVVILLSQITRFSKTATFTRWVKAFTGFVFLGFGFKLAFLRQPS